MLSSDAGSARAAAALALYYLSMASEAFCGEAFSSACNAVLLQRGEAAVLAAAQRLYAGDLPERIAATYLLHVSACNISRSAAGMNCRLGTALHVGILALPAPLAHWPP